MAHAALRDSELPAQPQIETCTVSMATGGDVNVGRGLFRLWVVASPIWIAGALWIGVAEVQRRRVAATANNPFADLIPGAHREQLNVDGLVLLGRSWLDDYWPVFAIAGLPPVRRPKGGVERPIGVGRERALRVPIL